MGAAIAPGCAAIADLDHEYELLPAAASSSGASVTAVGAGGGGGAGGGAGAGAGGVIPEGCGDGVVAESEKCDDGNTVDGDMCSSDCRCYADGDPDVRVIAGPGDGHCYFLVAFDHTAIDALNDCQDNSSYPVTITTEAELALIAPFLTKNTWIGGTDYMGGWTWVNGEPWTIKPCSGAGCDATVDLWMPGEPSDGATDFCLELDGAGHKFNATTCTQTQHYLCETSL